MEKNENTYADLVAEMAASFKQLRQNVAWSRVREIAVQSSSFKIGKTGEDLNTRFNQEDYRDKYAHIKSVFSSKNSEFVDETEVSLIRKAKMFANCQNKKETSSLHDSMAENADMYHVYIVWND